MRTPTPYYTILRKMRRSSKKIKISGYYKASFPPMDKIKDKLTPSQSAFFEHLSLYVDKHLYFYGSIMRHDYIPGKSDIDLAIFTDNEQATLVQLCSLLNLKRSDCKKTVYKIGHKVVHGYKCRYTNMEKQVDIEVSLYNEVYKPWVLQDQTRSSDDLPLNVVLALLVVKVLYYNLCMISRKTYQRIKRYLMSVDDEVNYIQV